MDLSLPRFLSGCRKIYVFKVDFSYAGWEESFLLSLFWLFVRYNYTNFQTWNERTRIFSPARCLRHFSYLHFSARSVWVGGKNEQKGEHFHFVEAHKNSGMEIFCCRVEWGDEESTLMKINIVLMMIDIFPLQRSVVKAFIKFSHSEN